MQLLDLLTEPWAIEPSKLREIQAIYATHLRGEKIDLDAIEARLQRPLSSELQEYQVREGGVATLAIEGVIAPKANLFTRISGGVSAQMLGKQIESAMADARVRSLILVMDSPGGSVFGGPEVASAIQAFAREKPIVTVSDKLMASMGYWIGSAANAIFITGPTVQVGSIGVVATHSYNPRAAEGTTEITAGRYKRIATENAPLSEEGRAYLQAQVDHIYTVFVNAVADHRGATPEDVLEHMADGRVFVGQQAIEAGLVDGVSTVDAIAEQLATNPDAFSKRRKARVPGAAVQSQDPGAGAAPPPATSSIEGKDMDLNKLKADHPDLFAQVLAIGAVQELERIKGVQATLIPGHEALVETMMFDGKTSAADAALKINAAERAIRTTQGNKEVKEAPSPVPAVPAPTTPAASAEAKEKAEKEKMDAMPIEDRCKAKWDANTGNVRGEFTSLAAYTAYTRAADGGKVRTLGAKA
jgi:signal peptide peptidase SppA